MAWGFNAHQYVNFSSSFITRRHRASHPAPLIHRLFMVSGYCMQMRRVPWWIQSDHWAAGCCWPPRSDIHFAAAIFFSWEFSLSLSQQPCYQICFTCCCRVCWQSRSAHLIVFHIGTRLKGREGGERREAYLSQFGKKLQIQEEKEWVQRQNQILMKRRQTLTCLDTYINTNT